ncbi:MAG: YhjD/YihY/BrkB family envelope integrity protein [Opitutales bacterium]
MSPPENVPKPYLVRLSARIERFWRVGIWERADKRSFWMRLGIMSARVLAILGQGIGRKNIPILAGALSYYTLVALGPLLAVLILVSSLVAGAEDRDRLAESLTNLVYAVAPALREADSPTVELAEAILDRELEADEPPSSVEAPMPENGGAPPENGRDDGTGLPETGAGAGVPSAGVAAVQAAGAEAIVAADAVRKSEQVLEDGAQTQVRRQTPAPSPGQVRSVINSLVRSARSGTFGAVGTLLLIFVSVQLLATMESTLNGIWGVSKDRPLGRRMFFYWSILSVGAILGALIITFTTAAQIAKLTEHVPFGGVVLQFWGILGPTAAFVLLILLLTLFYRGLPNTEVQWLPAAIGALLTAVLLVANQRLSFLYIGQVTRQQSLLGIVGILPVSLFGLYIFWLLVLVGGQFVYALQNVNILRNERAWEALSPRAGELFSLHLLIRIARRFRDGPEPPHAEELSEETGAPVALVNRRLNTLRKLGFIHAVSLDKPRGKTVTGYQPAVSLDQISLRAVHESLQHRGEDEAPISGKSPDPALLAYQRRLDAVQENAFEQTLDDLIREFPAKTT